ncbi:MAG: hypothetical protein LBI87_14890 [Candidatus Accumulibacter sp.]|nr:hypothetical protein [Accumulibacter sp.]
MAISGISIDGGSSPYSRYVAANAPRSRSGETLSEADLREIEELKATDRKVRQHEQAHMAAGGNLVTSGASYGYVTGPDGQRYAVSGEVGIDTSPGGTPEETQRIAARIRAAALAPADPSPQDRKVAAQAARLQMQAAMEVATRSGEPEESARREEAATEKTSPGAPVDAYRAMANAGGLPQGGFSVYA